jgi:hypothetical protein
VHIGQQVSRNWNRMDRVACAWDEWTPDTPLNRLFKCACRWLSVRVAHPVARGLLYDCLFLLDEVADVPPDFALQQVQRLVLTRATEPFRLSFDLAKRILSGSGPVLGAGSDETWVFLVDMNAVFEAFCHTVLEARFAVGVETQKHMGKLLKLSRGGIYQKADYYWEDKASGHLWIADAKYKHLAKATQHSLQFELLEITEDEESEDNPVESLGVAARRQLSPHDVRQITVYAELEKRRQPSISTPNLMLLYPFIGTGEFAPASCKAWNESSLVLMPVKVTPQRHLSHCLPLQ